MQCTYDPKRKTLVIGNQYADFIGEELGIRFYEDPRYGDEAGLWAVYKNRIVPTDYMELPDALEIDDASDFIDCYDYPDKED